MKSRPLHEKVIALAGALGVQALFLASLLVVGAPREYLIYEDTGGMVVDISGFGRADQPPPARSLADTMLDNLDLADAIGLITLPSQQRRSAPRSLADFFGDALGGDAQEQETQLSAAEAQQIFGEFPGELGDPRAQASTPRTLRFDANGQALPCWSKPEQPLDVRINVMLDPRGVMVGRPQVASAVNRDAERAALRAMAGCSPYHPPTVAGLYQVVELDFSRSDNWMKPLAVREIQ